MAARFVEQHAARTPLEHHRQLPDGRRTRPQHRERALSRDTSHFFGVDLVEELEADAATGRFHPGLHAGVGNRHAVHHEPGAHRVVLDEQAVGVGDEDAAPGVGVTDADLADRVTLAARSLVGALEHFGLASLRDGLRKDPDLVRALDVAPFERDDVRFSRCAARRSRSGRGGLTQPVFAQIGGVRVSSGVAADDADARSALAARNQLLDLGVVEASRGHPTIFGEHLGEVATVAQCGVQRAFENCFLDHFVTSVRKSPRQARTGERGCLS